MAAQEQFIVGILSLPAYTQCKRWAEKNSVQVLPLEFALYFEYLMIRSRQLRKPSNVLSWVTRISQLSAEIVLICDKRLVSLLIHGFWYQEFLLENRFLPYRVAPGTQYIKIFLFVCLRLRDCRSGCVWQLCINSNCTEITIQNKAVRVVNGSRIISWLNIPTIHCVWRTAISAAYLQYSAT